MIKYVLSHKYLPSEGVGYRCYYIYDKETGLKSQDRGIEEFLNKTLDHPVMWKRLYKGVEKTRMELPMEFFK